MKLRTLTILLFFICFTGVFGQNKSIKYVLKHSVNSEHIEISILLDSLNTNQAMLMIPRSGPGTYDLTDYLAFFTNVKGYTESNNVLKGIIGRGSFFIFKEENEVLKKISYEVNIKKMENDLLGGFASSKLRDNYLGILGYSVFGFIDGLENNPIVLEINTHKDWPIFSTLKPSKNRKLGSAFYEINNYALLADAQYLLGTNVQILEINEAKIPLFVAVYSETPINIDEIGRRGLLTLKGLANYFGYVPMPHYTFCYEFLIPFSDRHSYGFSMEHLNSMTASFDTSRAIVEYDPKAQIGSMVHHMGHSWVPLRSYGTGYRPFEWQTAPLIETIWLNEGFTWYVAMYHVLENKSILKFFNNVLESAPMYIQKKSLRELSLLGSTQYSMDFNIGRNLFSRGALLAHQLDLEILKKTDGKKSFKDAMLALLRWTEINQRAFEYNEIESIISNGVGVDISEIWNRWQEPMIK